MTSLKLVTLNIGLGFPGIDKSLKFLAEGQFDIACLQEVRETHLPKLAEIFPGAQYFAPMTRYPFGRKRELVGIGIFSRKLPFISTSAHACFGNVLPVPDLDGMEVDGSPKDIKRFRETENILTAFVKVNVGKGVFHFATTHGMWTPLGKADKYQRQAMSRFAKIIRSYSLSNPNLVFAGDLNTNRSGEIYESLFRGDTSFHDCVPDSIVNTIDWSVRGENGPNLVVDCIATWSSKETCKVTDVEAHFGVSDHAALSATVSRA